jgi:Spy/CpxP family protein refolding chaperone
MVLPFLPVAASALIAFNQAFAGSQPAGIALNSDAPAAIAQLPPSSPDQPDAEGTRLPPWADAINLSTQQRQQIQALHQQTKNDTQALRQQLQQAEQQLRSLLAGNASDDQLRQLHQQIQPLRQQLDDKRFDMLLAERQILTPEQRTQLAQWMQQHQPQQRGGRGNGRRGAS